MTTVTASIGGCNWIRLKSGNLDSMSQGPPLLRHCGRLSPMQTTSRKAGQWQRDWADRFVAAGRPEYISATDVPSTSRLQRSRISPSATTASCLRHQNNVRSRKKRARAPRLGKKGARENMRQGRSSMRVANILGEEEGSVGSEKRIFFP
jgi:hypothetical protein